MPIIDGAIILLRLAIIAIIGSALRSSASSSDGVSGLPSEVANSVNSGRYASSVVCAQAPEVTGTISGDGPSKPVRSRTCSSAIWASSPSLMRTLGSMLASACATGGSQPGELACSIPVERALTGQRLGQIAEHREVLERVLGPWSVCHEVSLRPASALASVVMTVASTTTRTYGVGQRWRRRSRAARAPPPHTAVQI